MIGVRFGPRVFAPADLGGRLEAVHLRHLHVHQHRRVRDRFQRGHGLAPVADDVHATAQLLQHAPRDQLIDAGVLGHQHERALRHVASRTVGALAGGAWTAARRRGACDTQTAARVLSNCAGRAGLVSTAAKTSAAVLVADRRQQHQRRLRDGRRRRGWPRPARARPCRACAYPAPPRRTAVRSAAASRRCSSALGPSATVVTSSPPAASCSRRMVRLVALSSTASTRSPLQLGDGRCARRDGRRRARQAHREPEGAAATGLAVARRSSRPSAPPAPCRSPARVPSRHTCAWSSCRPG